MDYLSLYTDFLKKHIDLKRPLTVVADASNGTTGPELQKLKSLAIPNLNLIIINDNPDPEFPAHGPNPLKSGATAQLAAQVLETGADFGAAFDADGDRAFFVDEKGETLPSHASSLIIFKHYQPPYVTDELVYNALSHMHVFKPEDIVPSRVGTYYVKETMARVHATSAAEFSGHYYFKDFFGSDSGIFAMITAANMLSRLDTSLSAFFASLPPHFLAEDSIKVEGKNINQILDTIENHFKDSAKETGRRDGLTLNFGDSWINIRPSNTEPILKFCAGSKSTALSGELIESAKSLVL